MVFGMSLCADTDKYLRLVYPRNSRVFVLYSLSQLSATTNSMTYLRPWSAEPDHEHSSNLTVSAMFVLNLAIIAIVILRLLANSANSMGSAKWSQLVTFNLRMTNNTGNLITQNFNESEQAQRSTCSTWQWLLSRRRGLTCGTHAQ